ncbi:MAG TPA: OmpH family outer membrane protein [Pseudomonadota bacterium]|jgi:outer membrane protein|nr:OmpH family outer membrane protein [Pseudomonadota bacterium]HNN49589.1 OmpH family outer membrane protein [Pseudomonadota bacterium]
MFNPTVRWTLGLGLALSVVLPAATAKAQQKIAIVDIRRAIEDSNEGKANIGGLKAEADRKQKELLQKQDELKKLEEDFLKQQSVLQPAAAQKKREELQQKVMQLQDALQRAQQDIGQKEAKVLQPLQDKVLRAIDALARRDNYNMVLRSDVVLWPQQSPMDITNEVIRKVNDMKAPTPAPAGGAPTGGSK